MELEVIPINILNENEIKKVDEFILDKNTNGEFINSYKFLSYQGKRFELDSIVIRDKNSGTIECVVMTTVEDGKCISHKGTTFAGPIFSLKSSYRKLNELLSCVLNYYENKYQTVGFKITPPLYAKQEIGLLEYILLQQGYKCGIIALSNVIKLNKIQTEDELFSLYDSKRRNQVKKSIKSSMFVFSKEDDIDEKIWQTMNQNLNNKYHVSSTHSYEEITELAKRFPENIVPYTVRTKNGDYAAFGLIFRFKNVFHTQYLDVNYSFSTFYPNLFLIHYLLLQAKEEGYSVFSFGASTENNGNYLNEQLLAYKAGYGGGNIILPYYEKIV